MRVSISVLSVRLEFGSIHLDTFFAVPVPLVDLNPWQVQFLSNVFDLLFAPVGLHLEKLLELGGLLLGHTQHLPLLLLYRRFSRYLDKANGWLIHVALNNDWLIELLLWVNLVIFLMDFFCSWHDRI